MKQLYELLYDISNIKIKRNIIIINKLIFLLFITDYLIKKKSKNNILNIKSAQPNFNFSNGFNNIPISYGLNNGNFYPTLTSITSILENANNLTYYIFYILVSKNKKHFSTKNKIKFKNIEKKYNRCKINIIEINEHIFRNIKIHL